MKKIILRIENWLLIIPGIIALIEMIFFGDSAFDLHLHDTYFVIAHFYIWILFFVLNSLPLFCHFLLRKQKRGNKKILFAHVLITNLLLIFFFIALNNYVSGPRRYYDFSNWKSFEQFGRYSSYLSSTILGFIIIQLLFILYTVVKLLTKSGFAKPLR